MTQRLQEAQNELKLSNERHTMMMEKYKKDLIDMRNAHTENTLKQEKALKNAADEYLKELANVR